MGVIRFNEIYFSTYLICIFIFFAPLDMILNLTGSGTILKFLGMLIIPIIFLEIIIREVKVNLRYYMIFALLYWIHFGNGLFWSVNPSKTFTGLISMGSLIALFIFMSLRKYNIREYEMIKNSSVFGIIILSSILIINYSGKFDRGTIVFNEVFVDPNDLAAAFIIPIVFCIDKMRRNGITKILWIFLFISILIMGYGLLVTGSRGGVLAVLASIFFYSIFSTELTIKRKLFNFTSMFILILVIYHFIFQFLPRDVKSRLSIEAVKETGGTGRVEIWLDALYYFKNMEPIQMFLGNGLGTFASIYEKNFFSYHGPHNIFLQSLLDGGIFGLTIFLILIISIIWYTIKTKNWVGLSILIGTIVVSLGLETWNKKFFWNAMFFSVLTVVPNINKFHSKNK